MKHKLTFIDRFLHSFRELFLYHHDSLEFRAKIYALMIVSNSDYGDERLNHKRNEQHDICEYEKLERIVEDIYPKDIHRQNTLILTTKEYVHKIREPNGLGIDELIFHIEKSLKKKPRYALKIIIEHLNELSKCPTDRDSTSYQTRIITFLIKLKYEYELFRNVSMKDKKNVAEIHNEDQKDQNDDESEVKK